MTSSVSREDAPTFACPVCQGLGAMIRRDGDVDACIGCVRRAEADWQSRYARAHREWMRRRPRVAV